MQFKCLLYELQIYLVPIIQMRNNICGMSFGILPIHIPLCSKFIIDPSGKVPGLTLNFNYWESMSIGGRNEWVSLQQVAEVSFRRSRRKKKTPWILSLYIQTFHDLVTQELLGIFPNWTLATEGQPYHMCTIHHSPLTCLVFVYSCYSLLVVMDIKVILLKVSRRKITFIWFLLLIGHSYH